MEIKILLGFGKKGQHTAREVNRNLETQVRVLTEALRKETAEKEELRRQLAEALGARVAKGRRLQLMQGRRLEAVQPVKIPARSIGATGVIGQIKKEEE